MPRAEREWVSLLNSVEQEALRESELFFQRRNGKLQRALSRVGRPLDALLRSSPEKLQNAVSSGIHGVLKTVADGAEGGAGFQQQKDELCARAGFELEPWERIFEMDFRALEDQAMRHLRKSRRLAVVQGGVTGATGLPGLAADIPSLYYLVFRLVHQIATTFGHPAQDAMEKRYLFQVVNVGHHLELEERRVGLLELEDLEREISVPKSTTTEDMQRALLAKSVQFLARRLPTLLLQRKATQTIAIIGGAVGAVINRQLVEDVGMTAIHAYRRRFLKAAAEARE